MALFKLAQHQSYASQMMENCGQLAIFYEAGTGKTMCALDYLYNAFKNGEIDNALIVCPASIVSNWRDSIEKMIKFRGYTAYGIRQMQQRIEVRSFQRTAMRVKAARGTAAVSSTGKDSVSISTSSSQPRAL